MTDDITDCAVRIVDLTLLIEDLDALCLQHCDLNDPVGLKAESDLGSAIDERRELLAEYRKSKETK